MAAKTEHIQLGSMVCVLPWHDPVRVAEQISMLDNLSDGRVILGMGRGTGRVEFDGFGVDMGTARLRFKESAEIVLNALEQGWIEYSGELLHQQRRDIRPRPISTFKGRTYAAAAISPDSAHHGGNGCRHSRGPPKTVEGRTARIAGLSNDLQRCEWH